MKWEHSFRFVETPSEGGMSFTAKCTTRRSTGPLRLFGWSAIPKFLTARFVFVTRKAMRGAATEKDDNQRVLRSLSYEQVMRAWQLAPHFWELKVLRLNVSKLGKVF